MADHRQPSSPVPCQRSGQCCSHQTISAGNLDASAGDIERWRAEGRDDILEWVVIHRRDDGGMASASFPVPPDRGEELDGCPFLEWDGPHSTCGIHDTKPYVCADFHCVTSPFVEGGAHQLAVEALRLALEYGLVHLRPTDDPLEAAFWRQSGEPGRVHDLVADAYRLTTLNDLIRPKG